MLLPGVDFVSMALQALPVVVLFELSIWLAVFFERRWDREYARSLGGQAP